MKAVNSFPFVQTDESETIVETPVVENTLDNVRRQIADLSADEIKTLLSQVFSSELNQLNACQKEKGFKEGLEQAKSELLAEHKKQQIVFKSQHEEKLKAIETVITQFSEQDLKIELKSESDMVFIVMQAILHLIGLKLEDKEYVKQLVQKLALEYSLSKRLILTLSPGDLELIRESIPSSKFEFKSDKSLSTGDYRLELDNGSEAFSLHCGLTQLVDTFTASLGKKYDS